MMELPFYGTSGHPGGGSGVTGSICTHALSRKKAMIMPSPSLCPEIAPPLSELTVQKDQPSLHAVIPLHLLTEQVVPRTRHLVTDALHASGESRLSKLADDAAVVTSELVTNAMQAARRSCSPSGELYLYTTPTTLVIAVRDYVRDLPRAVTPCDDQEHGRGLALVAMLAHRVGHQTSHDGKIVWAGLDLAD
mgnify:CR=1 FL=1